MMEKNDDCSEQTLTRGGKPGRVKLGHVRLTHIYHDICSTDDPVMEILNRHGFTNYKLFSRMFKEMYGDTPREIRRRARLEAQ